MSNLPTTDDGRIIRMVLPVEVLDLEERSSVVMVKVPCDLCSRECWIGRDVAIQMDLDYDGKVSYQCVECMGLSHMSPGELLQNFISSGPQPFMPPETIDEVFETLKEMNQADDKIWDSLAALMMMGVDLRIREDQRLPLAEAVLRTLESFPPEARDQEWHDLVELSQVAVAEAKANGPTPEDPQ